MIVSRSFDGTSMHPPLQQCFSGASVMSLCSQDFFVLMTR
jgi:hypothetical protein